MNYLQRISIFLIKIYQKTISPDHGYFKIYYKHGFCRFYPSCSMYAIGSIAKYGFFKGFFKAFYRILRCNPWNKGGVDYP